MSVHFPSGQPVANSPLFIDFLTCRLVHSPALHHHHHQKQQQHWSSPVLPSVTLKADVTSQAPPEVERGLSQPHVKVSSDRLKKATRLGTNSSSQWQLETGNRVWIVTEGRKTKQKGTMRGRRVNKGIKDNSLFSHKHDSRISHVTIRRCHVFWSGNM